TRLVATLDGAMGIEEAGLATDAVTGGAVLTLRLVPQSDADFAAAAGAPRDPRWDLPPPARIVPPRSPNPDLLRVVIDPGHGGVDPGAERGVVNEKTLMLTFARELEDALRRAGGFEVFLTRTDDYFVSLERRIAIAHEYQADVFLSLHADSLAEGGAHGATVYVLSKDASDEASAALAERHDRDDLLSGVDLSAADDEVTGILLDLARQETQPRTERLARALVEGMAQGGGPMNRRPLRRAAFSVLKAADIPSVLIEIGFLSSPRDLENLQQPEWRARMADGIRLGLQLWLREDAAMRPLVRQ
ncbi:MAG: N-acetylmuramoyl-L-alanine amidase, partial [Rhodobacteraceae bacterium]